MGRGGPEYLWIVGDVYKIQHYVPDDMRNVDRCRAVAMLLPHLQTKIRVLSQILPLEILYHRPDFLAQLSHALTV